jgi:hypothetical protein
MKVNQCIGCTSFPCLDVKTDRYILADIDIVPEIIFMIMISEAAPENPSDYYYANGNPLFQQSTLQAFKFAGVSVDSFQDLMNLGIYFTTAIKCGKTSYGIKAGTIKECSHILEKELSLFPNVKAYMLMGDVAIKGINYISKRQGVDRVIPAGSTYKIRGRNFHFRGVRAFPSYLQVGPSFGIEKSKQRMIGEDITHAMALLK